MQMLTEVKPKPRQLQKTHAAGQGLIYVKTRGFFSANAFVVRA